MKDLIIKLLRENLQQADKIYFKDGKLSPRVREHILKITNGDPYTKLLTDIYNQMLIENRKTSDDVLSDFYLTMLNEIYRELKNYNKNVFPISGFNINGVEDTADLINAITQREKILNILGGWSSIAKRNMKEDIREERNGRQMSHYLDQLEYAHGYLSMLDNRSEEAKNKILNKLFTNNTTIDNITDFIQDKGNLIGGEDLTKKQIHQILKKDKEEYDELKVKYNQNDIMIIEVSGPNGIKEIGCNSLWCFTYSRNNGGLNWGDWYNNSTNDVCYVIIDFKQPSDSEDFMYVLTKPIVENSEEYDEHDDENEGSLYDMSNEPVYSPIHTLDSLIGLDTAKRVMNFGIQQPKPPKTKRQKYVDPNQLALDLHETKKFIKNKLRENLNIHDIESMLHQIQPNCDCCKYFDMESLENYGGLVNPIYYLINKRELQELKFIPPKQYIYKIANGFGLSYEDAMSYAYQDEKAIKYSEMMKSGSKAPIGYFVNDKADQEGRHRASAAMKLNCQVIPVVEKTVNISNKFVEDTVLNLKGLSREQVSEIYKNKGYNGITDLDWRELQNYIEYRL